jgi:hypothetical protein
LSNILIYPSDRHPKVVANGNDAPVNPLLAPLTGQPQADISRDCDEEASHAANIARLVGQNNELRAEIEQLKAERNRLAEHERLIMELLGAKVPDKIIHDLRNVLNERDLLRVLTADM